MGKYEQIEKLQKLKESGSLSDQEYELEKKKILNAVETNGKRSYKFVIISITVAIIIISLISLILAVNSGHKAVQIPNLVGLSLEEAQALAKKSNLKLEKQEERYDLEVPEGQIIEQIPKYQANYEIKKGTTIRVTVSKGQK